MPIFKDLVGCPFCGKPLQIKDKHVAEGFINCTRVGCKKTIIFNEITIYDEAVLIGMKNFGTLVNKLNPNLRLTITDEVSTMGRSLQNEIVVPRIEHKGKCYVSSFHCTIKVIFDKWTGNLRYIVTDGALVNEKRQASTNGTFINSQKVNFETKDTVEIPDGGILNIGGADEFILEAYKIPMATLETYKLKVIDKNLRDIELTQ